MQNNINSTSGGGGPLNAKISEINGYYEHGLLAKIMDWELENLISI